MVTSKVPVARHKLRDRWRGAIPPPTDSPLSLQHHTHHSVTVLLRHQRADPNRQEIHGRQIVPDGGMHVVRGRALQRSTT